MDQLMIGYGVNNNNTNGANPPASFNPEMLVSNDNSGKQQNQPKKELTLTEKHELATKLDKDLTFDNKASTMASSMSLNNMKPLNTNNNNNNSNKGLADSLMDRNLADLNFSTSTNNNKTMMPTSASTNFSSASQQNRFPTSNNFGNQNAAYGNMGGSNMQSSFNATQFQRPPFQQQNMQQNLNNQQMGFFGNLALPAPGDAAKSSFPTILPPPSMNTTLKPATNLNAFNKTTPQAKKSALDDLADIFG